MQTICSLPLCIIKCTVLKVCTTCIQRSTPLYRYIAVNIYLFCHPALLTFNVPPYPLSSTYLIILNHNQRALFCFGAMIFYPLFLFTCLLSNPSSLEKRSSPFYFFICFLVIMSHFASCLKSVLDNDFGNVQKSAT